MEIGKDLIAASATPLLLGILSDEESYGYAIIRSVLELTGGEVEWSEGMLYPVLHRLEKQGFVESVWKTAESGRRRKYYRITSAGHEELARLKEQWRTVHKALEHSWQDDERNEFLRGALNFA